LLGLVNLLTHTLTVRQFIYHRLRGSGSTVVTMTSKVNGKTKILTPCRSEISKIIETKMGVNDSVIDPYNLGQFFCGNGPTGSASHIAEI